MMEAIIWFGVGVFLAVMCCGVASSGALADQAAEYENEIRRLREESRARRCDCGVIDEQH